MEGVIPNTELHYFVEASRSTHSVEDPIGVIIKAKYDPGCAMETQTLAFTQLVRKAASISRLYFVETDEADFSKAIARENLGRKVDHLFILCHGSDDDKNPGLQFGETKKGLLLPENVAKTAIKTQIATNAQIHLISCRAGLAMAGAFQDELPQASIFASRDVVIAPGYFYEPGSSEPLLLAEESDPTKIVAFGPHKSGSRTVVTREENPEVRLYQLTLKDSFNEEERQFLIDLAAKGDIFAAKQLVRCFLKEPTKAIFWAEYVYRAGGGAGDLAEVLLRDGKIEEARPYIIDIVNRGDYEEYERLKELGGGLSLKEILELARQGSNFAKLTYIREVVQNPDLPYQRRELLAFFMELSEAFYLIPFEIAEAMIPLVNFRPELERISQLIKTHDWASMLLYYYKFNGKLDPVKTAEMIQTAVREKNWELIHAVGLVLYYEDCFTEAAKMFGQSYEFKQSRKMLLHLVENYHTAEAAFQLFLKEEGKDEISSKLLDMFL